MTDERQKFFEGIAELVRDRDAWALAASQAPILHRPFPSLGGTIATVPAVEGYAGDTDLVARIAAAFRAGKDRPLGDTESFWVGAIAGMQKAEFETMVSGDLARIGAMLRDPGSSQLFIGFDDLVAVNPYSPPISDPGMQEWLRRQTSDALIRLAEAVGVIGLEYVENQQPRAHFETDALLDRLDETFGFRIDFPNPFAGQVGLATSRGIATYRGVQSLFQGWRIAQVLDDPAAAHVVEIGGGLGRTAYYALRFGVGRYTLIDLPLANVAQACYLGRTIGADRLRLGGETGDAQVTIDVPAGFHEGDERFDLAFNADSLVEMSEAAGTAYWRGLARRAPLFLSMNHEHFPFRVRNLIDATPGARASRTPYWLRQGYVEELVRFPAAQ